MELRFEISPEAWLKFQRLSGDLKKDPNLVLEQIISQAYEEVTKPKEPATEE